MMDAILPLLWDVDPNEISLQSHRDFIIRRVLTRGTYPMLIWLRQTISDTSLREWLLAQRGSGLTPRQAAFWGIVLDIPDVILKQWQNNDVWDTRCLPKD